MSDEDSKFSFSERTRVDEGSAADGDEELGAEDRAGATGVLSSSELEEAGILGKAPSEESSAPQPDAGESQTYEARTMMLDTSAADDATVAEVAAIDPDSESEATVAEVAAIDPDAESEATVAEITGLAFDPEDEDAVREDLKSRNERVPGTVGIHLAFDEAPIIVGFGTAYTEIRCTIYDSDLEILLTGELDPPERRSLRELLLPPRWPEVEGRSWGRQAWRDVLSHFFPIRG